MLLDNNMTEGTNCMCDLFFCAKSGQKPWGGGGGRAKNFRKRILNLKYAQFEVKTLQQG